MSIPVNSYTDEWWKEKGTHNKDKNKDFLYISIIFLYILCILYILIMQETFYEYHLIICFLCKNYAVQTTNCGAKNKQIINCK